MTKVAVVLSGCGFLDGSEINETVATFIALDKRDVGYQCLAPNIPQARVLNYLSGEPMEESRNVLIESARLARGDVLDIATADTDRYDAVIFPGGFGAATNLCDFAEKGSDLSVNHDVSEFAKKFVTANKPLGFICIAPALIPKICDSGVNLTLGNDKTTAKQLESMGAKHTDCKSFEIIVDKDHKVVTTPAYMLAEKISEVVTGVDNLVEALLKLI